MAFLESPEAQANGAEAAQVATDRGKDAVQDREISGEGGRPGTARLRIRECRRLHKVRNEGNIVKRIFAALMFVALLFRGAAAGAGADDDDDATLSGQTWDAPATHAEAVTPSDLSDLSDVTRWLYVGGTGDVAVVMKDGTTQTLPSLAAGTLLRMRVARVMATGTTASAIVALW